MGDPAVDGPELVAGPVAPIDQFDVPQGAVRDGILKDLGLDETYSDNRCGTMIQVAVDQKHVDLWTEYELNKSRDEKFADCFTTDQKKYKSQLPNRGFLGKTSLHMFKDHLVSKGFSQACLSKSYDTDCLSKSNALVINLETITGEPIRCAYHGRSDSVIIVTSIDIDRLPRQNDRRRMLLDIVQRVGDATVDWLRKPGADSLHELGLVDYESVRVRYPAPNQKGERDDTRAQKGKKKGEWDATHAQFGKGPDFGKDFAYGKGRFGKPDDWFDPWYDQPKGKFGKYDDWHDPWMKGKPGKFDFWHDPWTKGNFGKGFDDWAPIGKGFDDWAPIGKGFGEFGFGKSKDSPGEWEVIHAGKGPPNAPTAASRDASESDESSTTGHTLRPLKIFTLGAEYIDSDSLEIRLKGDPRIQQDCFVSCLPLRDKDACNRPTKHETGLDVSLQNKLKNQTGCTELLDQARKTLEKYGVLILWCRHGFHRSAGIAQILKAENPDVQCLHLTLHRHRDRYDPKPNLWGRTKMSQQDMGKAMDALAKKWPAGEISRAELQEQLYKAQLEVAEGQARARVFERKLQESKGKQNPGSASQSKSSVSAGPALNDPPKGSSNPGGTVLPPKDPKVVAGRLLSETLRPSKYQYMRTEGLCMFDSERKVYMCALCDVQNEETGKSMHINPITTAHLESSNHLRSVAWHYYMKGDQRTGDWYYELARRIDLKSVTSDWETVKRRKKGGE